MLKLKLQYLATGCKELTHWKSPWWWERLKAEEGEDRGWDGLMASLTRWTWVWACFRSWWWTGKPGMVQSMGSTESQVWLTDWPELNWRPRNRHSYCYRSEMTQGFSGFLPLIWLEGSTVSLTFSYIVSPGHTQGSYQLTGSATKNISFLALETKTCLLYSLTGFISFEVALPHNLGKQDNRILRSLHEFRWKKARKPIS